MKDTNPPANMTKGTGRAIAPSQNRKGFKMAESQAKIAWDKNHTSFVGLKLNKNTDAEIIAKLDTVPNKQGYIKQLIRADVARNER